MYMLLRPFPYWKFVYREATLRPLPDVVVIASDLAVTVRSSVDVIGSRDFISSSSWVIIELSLFDEYAPPLYRASPTLMSNCVSIYF